MKKQVLRSEIDPITKTIYKNEETTQSHYVVAFHESYDNSSNLCCSSQIGCAVGCKFCATGDSLLRRNLSTSEITEQFDDGITSIDNYLQEDRNRLLFILMEGMGEPTHNLENCLSALNQRAAAFEDQFSETTFKISTAGNLKFIQPYQQFIEEFRKRYNRIKFEFQLSLHSAVEDERRIIVPNLARNHTIGSLISKFEELADWLGMKFKCNYMLMNFPWGGNNYDEDHLKALEELLNPMTARIKLTQYSETGKGFSSPSDEVFQSVAERLESKGFAIQIKKLLGHDIFAACGMLHYED